MNLADLLPAGVNPDNVLMVLAGTAAAVSVYAVWSAFLVRDPYAKRARAIAEQRDRLRAGLLTPRRRSSGEKRSLSMMRKIVDKFKLMRLSQGEKVTMQLMRAGLRSKDALITFLFFKLAGPLIIGGIAAFLLYVVKAYDITESQKLLATVGSFFLGIYAPEVFVRNLIAKRKDKLRKALPDALDLMVICTEAGLSLDATLQRVSEEMATAQPELSDELSLTRVELGFLPDRPKALQNLAERTDLPGVRGLVNTLIQAERYGTPLAHSIRVMAAELREERMLKAEEKAARLPAMLTVPMIVFILPPLFVVLLGTAALDIIDALSGMG